MSEFLVVEVDDVVSIRLAAAPGHPPHDVSRDVFGGSRRAASTDPLGALYVEGRTSSHQA